MRFFLPTAKTVFLKLCKLDIARAELLVTFLECEASGASESDAYKKLAKSLGMSLDATVEVVRYLKAIRDVCQPEEVTDENVAKELSLLEKEYELKFQPNLIAVATVIKALFAKIMNPSESKARRIEAGLGSEMFALTSIVDLRPVFDLSRDKVETWVLGTRLRIDYQIPNGDDKYLLLELSEQSLKMLKSELLNIEKKRTAASGYLSKIGKE